MAITMSDDYEDFDDDDPEANSQNVDIEGVEVIDDE